MVQRDRIRNPGILWPVERNSVAEVAMLRRFDGGGDGVVCDIHMTRHYASPWEFAVPFSPFSELYFSFGPPRCF